MRIPRSERGQTIIFFTFFMVIVFLGMAALALDVGMLYRQKRLVQSAADAAAIAASTQYTSAKTDTATSASAAALQQGGINSAAIVTPSWGAGGTAEADVVVQVTQPVKTFFLGALNSAWRTINVSAMAEARKPAPKNGLITPNLTLNAGADIEAPTCGIVDNDNNASDLSLNSGVTINVGAFKVHGSAPTTSPNCGTCTTYKPLPTYDSPVVPDPFASLTPPTSSGLTTRTDNNISTSTTLYPGYYSAGLNFNGGSSAYTVTLNPGLYYLAGGINTAPNTTIKGDGVTLYFPSGVSVNINSGTTFNLTAPTSGITGCASCTNMLIWDAGSSLNLDAASNSKWGGAVYLPNGELDLNGGSTVESYDEIYAKSVMVNSAISLDCGAGNGKMALVQ
jgi:Flp pilus assembly protein TadG